MQKVCIFELNNFDRLMVYLFETSLEGVQTIITKYFYIFYFIYQTTSVKLPSLWDNIIEMCEKHDFLSEFQTHNKWIDADTTYSRFVEWLDIAHYYLINPKGNYILHIIILLTSRAIIFQVKGLVNNSFLIINNSFSKFFKN